jgi:hypothetical protein
MRSKPPVQSSLVYTPHKHRGITRIDFGSGLVWCALQNKPNHLFSIMDLTKWAPRSIFYSKKGFHRKPYSVPEVHELVAHNLCPRRWSCLDRVYPARTYSRRSVSDSSYPRKSTCTFFEIQGKYRQKKAGAFCSLECHLSGVLSAWTSIFSVGTSTLSVWWVLQRICLCRNSCFFRPSQLPLSRIVSS